EIEIERPVETEPADLSVHAGRDPFAVERRPIRANLSLVGDRSAPRAQGMHADLRSDQHARFIRRELVRFFEEEAGERLTQAARQAPSAVRLDTEPGTRAPER